VRDKVTAHTGPVLDKVTGFVTRGRELLVFRHPTAGVQLPAGTVEAGETPEAAVLREVREEAGLVETRIVRRLDSFPEEKPPDLYAFLRRVRARTSPRGRESADLHCRRGTWGRLIESHDGWANVAQDWLGRTGWVPSDALTANVHRHLFHLVPIAPTAETWTTRTDRHRFRLYWVPLTEDPGLVPSQAPWLAHVRPLLLDPTTGSD
jgi:8-oxo-dGTP pyrophosphatase MutT (NUDIX family)